VQQGMLDYGEKVLQIDEIKTANCIQIHHKSEMVSKVYGNDPKQKDDHLRAMTNNNYHTIFL